MFIITKFCESSFCQSEVPPPKREVKQAHPEVVTILQKLDKPVEIVWVYLKHEELFVTTRSIQLELLILFYNW